VREQTLRDSIIFALLVAIGVAGRWGQPDWCVTPIAATGLLAGFYFRRTAIAALVPLSAMLISDIALDGYQSFGVMLAVYVAMAAPALLGRWLKTGSGPAWVAKLAACSVFPATLFFLLSNLAVWAWSTSPFYEKTLAGLIYCYAQAVPFYARMLAGDVAFTALLFGAAAWALSGSRQLQAVTQTQR
jgi:hypothetical protein